MASMLPKVEDLSQIIRRKMRFKSLVPLKWKNLIHQTFKFDPLLCPCGATMKYEFESSHYP